MKLYFRMKTKISRYIYAIKNIESYRSLNGAFKEQNEALKEALKSPAEVVRALTDDKFKWFDYDTLDDGNKKKYFEQAKRILEMEVFQNEVAKLDAEFIMWAAKESRDFDGVLAMRHQMSGIALLCQRLAEVPNPEEPKKAEPKEPYSAL